MSFLWESDPFFRDPFGPVFDNYLLRRMQPFLSDDASLAIGGSDQQQHHNQHQRRGGNGNDNNNGGQLIYTDNTSSPDSNQKSLATTDARSKAHRTALESFFRGPRVDVTETPTQYIIKADLPGLSKPDVQIHVSEDMLLTLEGERRYENEEKNDKRHVVERSFGRFERSVRLPPDAVVENAEAKMENGVLSVVFGKRPREAEGRKKITVQ